MRAGCSDTGLVSPDGITVINNGDGTCTMRIDPMPDANGTATIEITVSDANKTGSGSFELTVTPTPDAPIAVNDFAYIPLSGRLSFSVLCNDHDVDGDELSVLSFDGGSLPGQLSYNADTRQFTYVATVGEQGAKTFTYTVTDNDPLTSDDTATVTLNVNSLTHAPQISAIGNRYIMEDGSANVSFTVTDLDAGDTCEITVASGNTSLVPEDFEHNLVVTGGNGVYNLYVAPAANQSGSALITITATDSAENTDTSSFYVVVYPQNDPPVAVNDDCYDRGRPQRCAERAGQRQRPRGGDGLRVRNISWPAHGWIYCSGGTYMYEPYGNFNGTETLVYEVTDGDVDGQRDGNDPCYARSTTRPLRAATGPRWPTPRAPA